jgi:hypothetical protein
MKLEPGGLTPTALPLFVAAGGDTGGRLVNKTQTYFNVCIQTSAWWKCLRKGGKKQKKANFVSPLSLRNNKINNMEK